MAAEFGKDALNVIKLASITALIIGFFQMAFYTLKLAGMTARS